MDDVLFLAWHFLKPGSHFLQMRVLNLTSHGCFRSECFAGQECELLLLRICDVKICIAFTGSMKRALLLLRVGAYLSDMACHLQTWWPLDSLISFQWAVSSSLLLLRPMVNQPMVSFRFMPRLLKTLNIRVTSASWNCATCVGKAIHMKGILSKV